MPKVRSIFMSTTIVPDPAPLNPNVTFEGILDFVHDIVVRTMGDMDKADDIIDHEYYAGLYDSALLVEDYMTKGLFNKPEVIEKISSKMPDAKIIFGVTAGVAAGATIVASAFIIRDFRRNRKANR